MARRWHITKSWQQVLAQEINLLPPCPRGPIRVGIVYPNTYEVGAANLGMQVLYRIASAHPEFTAERLFLPPSGEGLMSLEGLRPLSEFHLLLVTIAFENDLPNLVRMLMMGGLEPLGAERRQGPVVVAGGVVAMLNPEVVGPFVEGVLLGDAEATLGRLLDVFAERLGEQREKLVLSLAREVEGFYAPGFYEPERDSSGRIVGLRPTRGLAPRVPVPRHKGTLARSVIVPAPQAQFGGMYLVELGRGCPHGCRFCAAGHIFRPPRIPPAPGNLELDGRVKKVGLVAAAVCDVEGVEGLVEALASQGLEVGVSSLRAEGLNPRLARSLARAGLKSVAFAPEAGTQRLRGVLGKGLDEKALGAAVERALEGGIENIRLYFMVGLPTETDEDIEAAVALARAVHQQIRSYRPGSGSLTLSIAPFVPKPFTPFEAEPMAPADVISSRIKKIKKALRPSGIRVHHEVVRFSRLQGIISRADRDLAPAIIALARGEGLGSALAKAPRDPAEYAHSPRPRGAWRPWAVVDHGISEEYLWSEAALARKAVVARGCNLPKCKRCGVCK